MNQIITHEDQNVPSLLKSQSQIMMALSIERKAQNYTLLRAWDQMRAEQLSIHRKTISQLMEYAETSLHLSTNYINVVKQFLNDKHDQFTKYSKYPLAKPNINYENHLVSMVYKQSSEMLLKIYENSRVYQQNALSMALLVQNLQKKVQIEMAQKDSEMITLKQEVNSLNEQVLDVNQQASESCVNLSNIYHKEKSGNIFKNKEDFYALSEIFMVIAEEQTETQKQLGRKILNFFKWAEQAKQKRHQFLKGVLIQYYSSHQQMHKHQPNTQILQQIRRDQYRKDDCQVEDILDRQSRKDVNRMLGEQDKKLSMKDIYSYVEGLNFNKFDPRNLILKQTKALYKSQKGEEIQKYLIITVDAFLHFSNDKFYDPETVWSIKLDKGVRTKHISQSQLQISKDYSGGSLIRNLLHLKKDSNTVTLCLVFDSGDHKQQFCQFLQKILV